jgi:hypothetical protein
MRRMFKKTTHPKEKKDPFGEPIRCDTKRPNEQHLQKTQKQGGHWVLPQMQRQILLRG